jgi:pantoate--beta-alanine ligase
MKIVKSIEELRELRSSLSGSVGFVPTMGALHDGHISLIKKSKQDADITVVSIFVNPTQFLAGEDLDKYPRRDIEDIEVCKKEGVDVLFMPNIDTMYDKDEPKIKAPDIRAYLLEGFRRPGHFDGVLTIVLKLFNLVKPNMAFLGRKDAQQIILIKDMVKKLFLDISIVDCDTIREADGLAMSSRNVYLDAKERELSLKISESLFFARELIIDGESNITKIKNSMQNIMKDIDIEYIEITDRELNYIKSVQTSQSIILVAVKIGNTRLIDNIWI